MMPVGNKLSKTNSPQDEEFNQIKKLLGAVLIQAVKDLKKDFRNEIRGSSKHLVGQDNATAASWLMADDKDYVLSFQNVCFVLNIDSEKTRENILKYVNSKLQKNN